METLPQFNVIDILVLVILGIGLVRGLMRGLSGELAGLLSVVAAFAAGWYFYLPLSEYVADRTHLSSGAANTAAFFVLLVVAYIVMHILRMVIRHLMEFSFKGRIEKIGGALAGLIRAIAIAAALLLLVTMLPHAPTHRLVAEQSVFGHAVYTQLGPVYDSITEKYPAWNLPRGDAGDTPDVPVVDVVVPIVDVEEPDDDAPMTSEGE